MLRWLAEKAAASSADPAGMTADLKTFKLKARGDAGGGRTELLTAFAQFLKQFGMSAALNEVDHHLTVTSTKEQRERLWKSNRGID